MAIILTDIEGTTSSISFVKDVLFPYARAALPGFVRQHGQNPEVRKWLDVAARDLPSDCAADDTAIVALLQSWIDADRKHTALKALQGLLWQDGYASGEYRAHVYADASKALQDWHAAGHRLYVYSSGSVVAQRMFFAHSEAGDLLPLFSGHYDTEIGNKRDADSYSRIAIDLQAAPEQVIFLSDVVEELDAARSAGMQTVLVDRRDDYPVARGGEATHGHRRIESFAEIGDELRLRANQEVLSD
ncbi:MAG: acireductone synthase [Pseudomarimonas sp.]